MAKDYVTDLTCKERTNNIIDKIECMDKKIQEIKGNHLVHLDAKIEALSSKMWWQLLVTIVIAIMAGINIAKMLNWI